MKNITKGFPGVLALDNVNISVEAGECHALVGENGAGKSTLMKILSGAYQPDSGSIKIEGTNQKIDSPIKSNNLGISMIYQELNLVPEMTIAENIFLGHELTRRPFSFLDQNLMQKQSEKLLARLGQNFNSRLLIKEIGLAQQQMVEIAKALSRQSRIIIMDEPSAILSEVELTELFKLIRRLKERGVGIVYISHRLEEVFKVCDRTTVLRDGKNIITKKTSQLSQDEIIRCMVGRTVATRDQLIDVDRGEEVLRLVDIGKKDKLFKINLSLYEGEIVSLAGLVGSGRTELAELIFGSSIPDEGQIFLDGNPINFKSPKDAINRGIGFLTEDRKSKGLILGMNIRENTTLSKLVSLSKLGIINNKLEKEKTEKFLESLSIKAPSTEERVANLSGGTQQKVVLSKWLFTKSRILIFDEPTRGIDVGAKVEIYQLMESLVRQGITILMISSDLSEVLRMSNRVLVMNAGRIKGELKHHDASQEKILELAMGFKKES
ncbi:MAG: sugar ABC transporter ATP-binding protein [Acidobacteriia bacterium]|nr:sugar ABC transporter ATP-binding protein [Terriglobia bacterium]